MELSIHGFIGSLVMVYVIEAFVLDFWRKRSKKVDGFLNLMSLDRAVPDKIKWWFMAIFATLCIYLYTYCAICKALGIDGVGDDRLIFEWIWRDMLGILPWFVWGCIIAGFVMKYFALGKLRLPKSMLGNATLASMLPICSCAAVPMAHGMMMGRQVRVRSIITFLIVVPVLSPIVFIMASSQIGIGYLVVEVISVFALAMATGIVVERFAGVRMDSDPSKGCYSCEGCKSSHLERGRKEALLAGWDQFMYLLKYILLGVIIGAALSAFVEPADLAQLFGGENAGLFQSVLGLVLIVLIGIPMFICSGEDVLILAPLLAMGLPLGHAVAFAITGNAICISSIPVTNATFGKKVTAILVASFFVGAIAIGLIINSLVWMFT